MTASAAAPFRKAFDLAKAVPATLTPIYGVQSVIPYTVHRVVGFHLMKTSVCQGNVDSCKFEETYLVLPFMSRDIVSILETLRDSLDQGHKLGEVGDKSFPIVDFEKDKSLGLLWKAAPV